MTTDASQTGEVILCPKCRFGIDIGNGWDMLFDEIICPECKTSLSIIVEEDSDCNYWFELTHYEDDEK